MHNSRGPLWLVLWLIGCAALAAAPWTLTGCDDPPESAYHPDVGGLMLPPQDGGG